jgi:hypothetical protein
MSLLFNLTSLISICSSLSSQHGGYYTSLLSQYDEDVLGDKDPVEVENEVMDVSPMTGMTSDSKIKGRSKNFSEQEDNLLVSAWLNVGQDPVDGNQQKNTTFWGRVEKYYHEHRTFDSDRNWSSPKLQARPGRPRGSGPFFSRHPPACARGSSD